MAHTVFPFNDYFRVTFNGSLLPSQSQSGEIIPPVFSDSPLKTIVLEDAPSIPNWRNKENSTLLKPSLFIANFESKSVLNIQLHSTQLTPSPTPPEENRKNYNCSFPETTNNNTDAKYLNSSEATTERTFQA
ncbi:uncharacterized protein CELE_F44A6.3 [Caenorhabditis elegans]|uniref:Uncharacterized protein n=1 Tax=Caenorhabditis elegans TaxID=6239 RepID=Q20385_CAEEL|nr:Uncharacterized protein CELE_F44A6.3 [Caenorhabditis elegans]CAA90723.1 Uncharacterized protein CELE_F44A6.3 [Caenorhabditis elegans]|eukprot:NP_509715.1 Uncharacterized protein CELE_F44A6.3 [Caenorhabditis elegans]